MNIEHSTIVPCPETSPEVGEVWWAARDGALVALGFAQQVGSLCARLAQRFPAEALREHRDAGGFRAAIAAYFGGELGALDHVPVDLGGTPFQARVWEALRRIPAGETRSYAELARAVGSPGSVRAVGTANGRNPVSIVVPCHRVIGSDGALHGYAGGLARKQWLLAHERA